ncbi:hypothetical protein BDP27DRAFT_449005 [Rhodocollybia butyracea]|uniref:Uncharacterized protein n=1 Tax=Rhodocollybia butyracea TaxID=206335 RepID=A0A9P5TZS8_9AGAR|nr:hypothetical protein BDP27DRAFT_449005 [Rhodocollybia butyracea]
METPTAIPTIPRLRVSRENPHQSTVYDYSGSQAGPSRLQSSTNLLDLYNLSGDADDDEQEQDTPRLPTLSTLPIEITSNLPDVTPAARLKAVLERTSARSKPPPAPAPLPSSASLSEFSDFEIPTIGNSQTSLARETLHSLFSHALREAGDTPQKSAKGKMKRRNSIDPSEFESSPRVSRKDRTDLKGKRKSMSDDEFSVSNVSSHAAVFDTLRQRLDSSSRQSPASNVDPDASLDAVKFMQELNASQFMAPVATSTPQHSLKMSVNSQFQTNLMDQDSEMQQAMRDLDSYENSLPAANTSKPTNYVAQPDRSHSSDILRSGRQKTDILKADSLHLSRSKESIIDLHEREREWNKRHTLVIQSQTRNINIPSLFLQVTVTGHCLEMEAPSHYTTTTLQALVLMTIILGRKKNLRNTMLTTRIGLILA